jgi:hypothetical protein
VRTEYWVAAASVTRRAGHELPMRMPTTKTSTPPTMTGIDICKRTKRR